MVSSIQSAIAFIWRWSLIVTVPVASAFLLWAFRTGEKYEDLGVKFATHTDHMSLYRIGNYEAHGVMRDISLALRPRTGDEPPRLRNIELYVPDSSERRLNSELPHSGREYVAGSLQYPDGTLGEVKLRYRGDHFWHWGARKKSLRVKTKKKQLFERMRAMNFSVPKSGDQIVEQLSNELALRFGLIAPHSEMINLRVNGRNRGVHLLVEQLEEMVVRKSGKMPGDLYSGDMVKRNRFVGVASQLFSNPALWEKIAINNHFPEDEDTNLRRLASTLDMPPSEARTLALRDLLDIESFGRFSAFRTVCQTFHFDDRHNQRLYFDPWRNHFLPVVWDSLGWHQTALPRKGESARPDVMSSELDVALFDDPQFLAARQRAFEDWFGTGKHDAFMGRVDELIAQLSPSLDRDPGLGSMLTLHSPENVRRRQAKTRLQIDQIGRELRAEYMAAPDLEYVASPNGSGMVRLQVNGRKVAHGVELAFDEPLDGRVEAFLAFRSPSGEPKTIDVSSKVDLLGSRLRVNVPLCAELKRVVKEHRTFNMRNFMEPQPTSYQLILRGGGVEERRVLRLASIDSLGDTHMARKVRRIVMEPFKYFTEVVSPAPFGDTERWSGEVIVEGVRRIKNNVILAPGTVLRMAPAASLIFEGRLIARGTKQEPITVEPLAEGQEPWGTLAVRGPGADESQIAWLNMRFGSGLKSPEAEFSAMLSIHDVDDAVIEDCLFEDSQVVDDMVHVVYSTIHITRCKFVRSLMDALDIDISEAVVSDCQFIESGNDSLDLMTSTVVAMHVTSVNSGDKGVSVGEDTTAMLLHCSLIDGAIGAEMKDRSRAIIVNSEIRGNDLGINAYKKNWRYDSGGFASVYNSVIERNDVQLGADKYSFISVHDSYVRPRRALEKKQARRIHFDKYCDRKSKTNARQRQRLQVRGESEGSPSLFQEYWGKARSDRRGPLYKP